MDNQTLVLYAIPASGVLALLYALFTASWINKQPQGTEKMVTIAGHIADGAIAFLKREYKVLIIFVVSVAIILGWANMGREGTSPMIAVSFVVGAFCSALAGFFGMKVATKANVRTTHAARTGLAGALNIAFSGGLVMGLSVVGLGIIGLSGLFIIYSHMFTDMGEVINLISGFSLGASSIALFARVGGGIYTKAADVGADLAGKFTREYPKMTPATPQPLPTMLVIMLVMLPAWEPIFLKAMLAQSSVQWFLEPHSFQCSTSWDSRTPLLQSCFR